MSDHARKHKPGDEPDSTHDISDEVETAAQLADRVAKLEAELLDANSKYLRTAADYQNSQRRALQNEQLAKAAGVANVAEDVVRVIDHFDLALNQDTSKVSAEQIAGGVRVIRDELFKVLSSHGVSVINPAKGDEFVPGRHAAVMEMPAEGAGPGTIAQTFQAGYALANAGLGGGEKVLRPAQVAVVPKG